MLSRLAKQKLVEHGKYEGVKLTRKGEDIARTTVFKHRVIELFLVKMLKRGKNEVHGEAHRLEHAFSEKSVKEIYKLVGKPRTGVHGEEIPAI
jgi:DtxR family Mn-dependent transcriptional regulator